MLSFLFLLFPAALTIYFVSTKQKKHLIVSFIGLAAGILVCIFKWIFVYAHRVISYSLAENVIHYLIQQSLLPVVIVYGLFFLISRDEIKDKINAFFPLLAAFYAVYMPYSIVSSVSSIYSSYQLFVKPLVYGMMLAAVALWLWKGRELISEGKKGLGILYFVVAVIMLIVPAFFDAYYDIGGKLWIIIIYSVLLFICPNVVVVYQIMKK